MANIHYKNMFSNKDIVILYLNILNLVNKFIYSYFKKNMKIII